MKINNYTFLDNASTTKPYEEVINLFSKISNNDFYNPSSIHHEGQRCAFLLKNAHEEILSYLKLKDYDAIYVSGATEANNLAIKGFSFFYKNRGKHIITSEIEHPSVLDTFSFLEKELGFSLTLLKPNKDGIITLESLKNAIRKDTILVSLMAVNNETGIINPIEEIALFLKNFPKIIFHVDAVQAIGKIPLKYDLFDSFTITGHKIHGLKGVGVLFKKKKLSLTQLNIGGGQESSFRSGTSDLAGILSFNLALKKSLDNQKKNHALIFSLAEKLTNYILNNQDLYELNSYLTNPFIVNFSLKKAKASVVVEALSNNGFLVSSISACHSKNEKGSYVIKAMGKDFQIYMNTIRVSFSEFNNINEIEDFIKILDKIVREVKYHD